MLFLGCPGDSWRSNRELGSKGLVLSKAGNFDATRSSGIRAIVGQDTVELLQDADGGAVVRLVALPQALSGEVVDVEPRVVVERLNTATRIDLDHGRVGVDRLTVGVEETQCPVVEHLDREPPLVDHLVVETAQARQVGERGLPAVCPMRDVMRLEPAPMGAAGEAAAAVAGLQRALDGRGHGAGPSSDVERLALGVLE